MSKILLAIVTVGVMVALVTPAAARPIHDPGPPERPAASGGPYAPRMDLWIVIITAAGAFTLGALTARMRRPVPA
jgi:hypothetical protein